MEQRVLEVGGIIAWTIMLHNTDTGVTEGTDNVECAVSRAVVRDDDFIRR